MRDFSHLLRDHAHWADEVNRLKKLGAQSAEQCVRRQLTPQFPLPDTCIREVLQRTKDTQAESGYYETDFETEWADAIATGDVCEHCQAVRRHKADRMAARKRLGAVRAAITRVGRNMANGEGQ